MSKLVSISKEIEWDMGHRVPNHKSKCRNPHGHRYKLEVMCSGSIILEEGRSDTGMLVDFSDLKVMMTELIHDVLDHGFMMYDCDLALARCFDPDDHADPQWNIIRVPFIPTAENIAIWCWDQLKMPIEVEFGRDMVLSQVSVWETPTSVAYYNGVSL